MKETVTKMWRFPTVARVMRPWLRQGAVWDEVGKGRVLGPFPVAPLRGFKVIARAMVDERAKSGKFRPISANNLPEGEAVNEVIAKYDDPICMATHKRMQQLMRHAKARSGKVVSRSCVSGSVSSSVSCGGVSSSSVSSSSVSSSSVSSGSVSSSSVSSSSVNSSGQSFQC